MAKSHVGTDESMKSISAGLSCRSFYPLTDTCGSPAFGVNVLAESGTAIGKAPPVLNAC